MTGPSDAEIIRFFSGAPWSWNYDLPEPETVEECRSNLRVAVSKCREAYLAAWDKAISDPEETAALSLGTWEAEMDDLHEAAAMLGQNLATVAKS
ncbi:hypothetical protein [Pseudoclavibacter terrae]|uniref:hypothetical protein n=1 Tax=Pseudoclavibacter terrae TaxID=1530195 RepID=UPI00232CEE14|nr:hypothetical protein [Pseudoclavibacter terrae]